MSTESCRAGIAMDGPASTPLRRINTTAAHLAPGAVESRVLDSDECAAARSVNRFKWNGYGYADAAFHYNKDIKSAVFEGHMYEDMHGRVLPYFLPWAQEALGLDVQYTTYAQPNITIPPSIINQEFIDAMKSQTPYIRMTFDDNERLFHGHGHALEEIYRLRHMTLERVPDVVIYPGSHAHVEAIVKAATANNVVLIPFGGGTNVTLAVFLSPAETRMIVSLDMREMNKIKWVDRDTMVVCIEAGACGEDIERNLREQGLCIGMEPDSFEFSTLGGWISTRASGMKKNLYGNIEDMLISCKLVTPNGLLEKTNQGPRFSSGPDMNEMVIGSEGNFGVVTEAVLKVRLLPECQKFGAIVFPSFEAGFHFMHELGKLRVFPASIRLVDNDQFRLASALKGPSGFFKKLTDRAKQFYVSSIKGFDVHQLCAATVVYEGYKHEVDVQERIVNEIAKKYNALFVNPEESKRAYTMTFMIAYIRDLGMDFYVLCESVETSLPFGAVLKCCEAVNKNMKTLSKAHGISHSFICHRITQIYETGCCVYFFWAINYKGVKDPLGTFNTLEHQCRQIILDHGGTISHHHGVGKLRADFIPKTMGNTAVSVMQAMKKDLDPRNIFATHNLGL